MTELANLSLEKTLTQLQEATKNLEEIFKLEKLEKIDEKTLEGFMDYLEEYHNDEFWNIAVFYSRYIANVKPSPPVTDNS